MQIISSKKKHSTDNIADTRDRTCPLWLFLASRDQGVPGTWHHPFGGSSGTNDPQLFHQSGVLAQLYSSRQPRTNPHSTSPSSSSSLYSSVILDNLKHHHVVHILLVIQLLLPVQQMQSVSPLGHENVQGLHPPDAADN